MNTVTKLIPSATTVLLNTRDTNSGFEVLLLKRNNKIKTHGGSWVFPGGKCDISDCETAEELENFNNLEGDRQIEISKQAACREAFEEASVNLASSSLDLCSVWITPPSMPKRFNAFFFIGEYSSREVKVDHGEISDFSWLTPSEALNKQAKGELNLPPPTFVTLTQLLKYENIKAAIGDMSKSPITYKPKLLMTKAGFHSIYEEDLGYSSLNPKIDKPCHRLVVESSQFNYLADF